MTQPHGTTRLTRRQAIGRAAGAGLGALAVLKGGLGLADPAAQLGGVQPIPLAPDPLHPQPPTWDTQLQEVAPNVYAYIQAGGPGRDNAGVANAGVIIGEEGVMVIDTLTAPLHARALIEAIRTVTDKPFRHVVNTHHHGDHVNGNQYFERAEIISHPYCRDEVVKGCERRRSGFLAETGRAGRRNRAQADRAADNDLRRHDDLPLRRERRGADSDGAGAHLR